MLNVVRLSVVVLSVVVLSVVRLSIVRQNVVMLSVVEPVKRFSSSSLTLRRNKLERFNSKTFGQA
jgi:hypothetical protein